MHKNELAEKITSLLSDYLMEHGGTDISLQNAQQSVMKSLADVICLRAFYEGKTKGQTIHFTESIAKEMIHEVIEKSKFIQKVKKRNDDKKPPQKRAG